MGQFLIMLVLLVVPPMQACTQESEQSSKNVQEKRQQRQRLQLSPGERLARAMGEITVESLNGLWIFSTSSKGMINRYELTNLHKEGPILFLEGIDLDEGTPVVLFHRSAVEEINKKNAFVLIDPDEEGCDVFFYIEPSRIRLKVSTIVRRRGVKPYMERRNFSLPVATRSRFASQRK